MNLEITPVRIPRFKIDVNIHNKNRRNLGEKSRICPSVGSTFGDGLEGAFRGEELGFLPRIEMHAQRAARAVDAHFDD